MFAYQGKTVRIYEMPMYSFSTGEFSFENVPRNIVRIIQPNAEDFDVPYCAIIVFINKVKWVRSRTLCINAEHMFC